MSHPALDEYRETVLQPVPLLAFLREQRRVLLPQPPGIGKSRLLTELVKDGETWKRYGLVIYAAATTELLNEMAAKLDAAGRTHTRPTRQTSTRTSTYGPT